MSAGCEVSQRKDNKSRYFKNAEIAKAECYELHDLERVFRAQSLNQESRIKDLQTSCAICIWAEYLLTKYLSVIDGFTGDQIDDGGASLKGYFEYGSTVM